MLFETEAGVLHASVEDGRLKFGVSLASGDDVFHEAAKEHCFGSSPTNEGVEIFISFEACELLGDIIEGHEDSAEPGRPLGQEARPLIEALRVELQKMITKIDAIQYAEG